MTIRKERHMLDERDRSYIKWPICLHELSKSYTSHIYSFKMPCGFSGNDRSLHDISNKKNDLRLHGKNVDNFEKRHLEQLKIIWAK